MDKRSCINTIAIFDRCNLKENIAFSLDDELINDKKIKECIEKSQLTKLVNDLEFGENTSIGERGLKISGGQNKELLLLEHYIKILLYLF